MVFPNNQNRLRLIYSFLILATVVIGLGTRKAPELFPGFIAEYGGDTLWATLFFFILRAIFLQRSRSKIAIITYAFGVLIECSQLYQAEWIIGWRKTFAGQMLLGQGFLWSDLLCYAVGVLLGWAISFMIESSTATNSTNR